MTLIFALQKDTELVLLVLFDCDSVCVAFTNRTQNGAGLFVNPTNISCFILFSLGTVWQTQFILICPIFLLRIYGFTEWKLTDTENTIRGIFVLKYWSCIGSHSSKVIIEFAGSNRAARAGKYCWPEPETVSKSKRLWVCVSFSSVYCYELIMRRKRIKVSKCNLSTERFTNVHIEFGKRYFRMFSSVVNVLKDYSNIKATLLLNVLKLK